MMTKSESRLAFLSAALHRLRQDFRLSILTGFAICAAVAISPFAVFRATQGAWVAAAVDAAIVLILISTTAYAWRNGKIEAAARVALITVTAGSLLIVMTLGQTGLFWLFPALMANAFLVRPGIAGAAALAATAAVQFAPNTFTSATQQLTVTVTLLLTALFAYIFAKRSDLQKQTLEALATLDPLTGARNRRAMEDELAIAINAFRRNGRPIALVMLDLDHFKHVNDRFGHEEGDRVLREFVRLLKASTRATDRLFRFGGEEFVLLMEHTDELRASHSLTQMLDRLRGQLRTTDGVVTVSAGAAVLGHGEDRNHWLARADAALYQAKQQGRDRAVVAAAAPSGPQGRA